MSNVLEYKGYIGSVDFSADDGVLHGKLQGIRDLVTYEACDVEGLRKAFEESVEDYLMTCEKKHKKPEQVFKGVFNVRVGPELHRRAFIYSAEHHKKLNAVVSEALEKFLQAAY